MNTNPYRVTKKGGFSIAAFDTFQDGGLSKDKGLALLEKNVKKMAELQDRFYAQDRDALLLIFQAMDSAGKDGAVKHVMSGLNPQGVQVYLQTAFRGGARPRLSVAHPPPPARAGKYRHFQSFVL